jgi:hypothetical protein
MELLRSLQLAECEYTVADLWRYYLESCTAVGGVVD